MNFGDFFYCRDIFNSPSSVEKKDDSKFLISQIQAMELKIILPLSDYSIRKKMTIKIQH